MGSLKFLQHHVSSYQILAISIWIFKLVKPPEYTSLQLI